MFEGNSGEKCTEKFRWLGAKQECQTVHRHGSEDPYQRERKSSFSWMPLIFYQKDFMGQALLCRLLLSTVNTFFLFHILPITDGYYWILPDTTGYYSILPDTAQYYPTLPDTAWTMLLDNA